MADSTPDRPTFPPPASAQTPHKESLPEQGWYTDPWDDTVESWWDGTEWTERSRPRHSVSTEPERGPLDLRNDLASWSAGLGLAAFLLGAYGLALPAVVCGHMHLYQTDRGKGRGRGIAITGLLLAYGALVAYLGRASQASGY